MGDFEKLIYGILLASFCLVSLSNFYITSAVVYGVAGTTDVSGMSQLDNINSTFKDMNEQITAKQEQDIFSSIADFAGLLLGTGVNTVKMLAVSLQYLQTMVVESFTYLGIPTTAEGYVFIITLISVFLVFALIKVFTGRTEL